ERIGVLQEYLCFQGKNEFSDKYYSNKFGRSENRIKLVKEDIKYPVEVEALYSLTSLLFDESVAISPVIINRTTGESCNFQRKDLDVVYEIYKDWIKKMKEEGFDNITWPLKNSNYMWLGEDVVDDIETLIRKEI